MLWIEVEIVAGWFSKNSRVCYSGMRKTLLSGERIALRSGNLKKIGKSEGKRVRYGKFCVFII